MDDSVVNVILNLAKLKMGLPLDSQPDTFYVHVTHGDQQCVLTLDELKAKKLNLPQSSETNDFNSNYCKEEQSSNQRQPIDLSSVKEENSIDVAAKKQTSLVQVKTEKYEYKGTTCDSSKWSKVLNTIDEQVTSEQYYASAESNDSTYARKQESTVHGSSKELGEELDATPKPTQMSISAAENKMVDNTTKVEEKKVESTFNVDQESNQKHDSNHTSPNYYSPGLRKRCYWCHELVYHRAWNCPKKRDGRDENKSRWSSSYMYPTWRPQYRRFGKFERNNPFNNVGIKFNRKDNACAKRGTLKSAIADLQNSYPASKWYPEPKWWPSSIEKKSTSTETDQHHKILFRRQWYTNRIAADAELFLNKKEEVGSQIKKEHRDLDEGFEDIQQVLSEDENQNENPVFVYEKNSKDEGNDPDSSSFTSAA